MVVRARRPHGLLLPAGVIAHEDGAADARNAQADERGHEEAQAQVQDCLLYTSRCV